jgi:ABC-type multidrug transport system ATPase subunit
VLDGLLDQVGLERRARDRAARTYSRGMVQRLALARALLTRPSLLLLDEPFTGLDRDGALALGAQLGALRDAGAIVVVVTHDLEAIADRTDHVAILRRGQLVFEERGTYTYDQLKDVYHRHAN